MNERYETGKKIRKARIEKGLTQEELADKVGYTKQTISNWENGKSTPGYEDKLILSKELEIIWNHEEKTNMQYKELMELNSIDEVISTVDSIVKYLNIESPNKNNICKILNSITVLLTAYYIYVVEPKWRKKYDQYKDEVSYSYEPPEWDCLAEEIRTMLGLRMGECIDANGYNRVIYNPIYQMIEQWTSTVQLRLWDDHGEGDDHIFGFKQNLAQIGLDHGYKLQNILQKTEVENSFTTELRCALTDLQEFLCEM